MSAKTYFSKLEKVSKTNQGSKMPKSSRKSKSTSSLSVKSNQSTEHTLSNHDKVESPVSQNSNAKASKASLPKISPEHMSQDNSPLSKSLSNPQVNLDGESKDESKDQKQLLAKVIKLINSEPELDPSQVVDSKKEQEKSKAIEQKFDSIIESNAQGIKEEAQTKHAQAESAQDSTKQCEVVLKEKGTEQFTSDQSEENFDFKQREQLFASSADKIRDRLHNGKKFDLGSLVPDFNTLSEEAKEFFSKDFFKGFSSLGEREIHLRQMEHFGASAYSALSVNEIQGLIKQTLLEFGYCSQEQYYAETGLVSFEEQINFLDELFTDLPNLDELVEELSNTELYELPEDLMHPIELLFVDLDSIVSDEKRLAAYHRTLEAYKEHEDVLVYSLSQFKIGFDSKVFNELLFYYYLLANKSHKLYYLNFYETLVRMYNQSHLLMLTHNRLFSIEEFNIAFESLEELKSFLLSQENIDLTSEDNLTRYSPFHFCFLSNVLDILLDEDIDLFLKLIGNCAQIKVNFVQDRVFKRHCDYDFSFIDPLFSYLCTKYAWHLGLGAIEELKELMHDPERRSMAFFDVFLSEKTTKAYPDIPENLMAFNAVKDQMQEAFTKHSFSQEMEDWAYILVHQRTAALAIKNVLGELKVLGSASFNSANLEYLANLQDFILAYCRFHLNLSLLNRNYNYNSEGLTFPFIDDSEIERFEHLSSQSDPYRRDLSNLYDKSQHSETKEDGEISLEELKSSVSQSKANALGKLGGNGQDKNTKEEEAWYDQEHMIAIKANSTEQALFEEYVVLPLMPGMPAHASFLLGRCFACGELVGIKRLDIGRCALIYADLSGNYLASIYVANLFNGLFEGGTTDSPINYFMHHVRALIAKELSVCGEHKVRDFECCDYPEHVIDTQYPELFKYIFRSSYDLELNHSKDHHYANLRKLQHSLYKQIFSQDPNAKLDDLFVNEQFNQTFAHNEILSNAIIILVDYLEQKQVAIDKYVGILYVLMSILVKRLELAQPSAENCLAMFRFLSSVVSTKLISLEPKFKRFFQCSALSSLVFNQVFGHKLIKDRISSSLISSHLQTYDLATLFLQLGMIPMALRKQGYSLLDLDLEGSDGNLRPIAIPYLDQLFNYSAALQNANSFAYLSEINRALSNSSQSDLLALVSTSLKSLKGYRQSIRYCIKNDLPHLRLQLAREMVYLHQPYGYYEMYLNLKDNLSRVKEAHTWLFYASRMSVAEAMSDLQQLQAKDQFTPLPFVLYLQLLERMAKTNVHALAIMAVMNLSGELLPQNSIEFYKLVEQHQSSFVNANLKSFLLENLHNNYDNIKPSVLQGGWFRLFNEEYDALRLNAKLIDGNFAKFQVLSELYKNILSPKLKEAYTDPKIQYIFNQIFDHLKSGHSEIESLILFNWTHSLNFPDFLSARAQAVIGKLVEIDSPSDLLKIEFLSRMLSHILDNYRLHLDSSHSLYQPNDAMLYSSGSFEIENNFNLLLCSGCCANTYNYMLTCTLLAIRGQGHPHFALFQSMCRHLANAGVPLAATYSHIGMNSLMANVYGEAYQDFQQKKYQKFLHLAQGLKSLNVNLSDLNNFIFEPTSDPGLYDYINRPQVRKEQEELAEGENLNTSYLNGEAVEGVVANEKTNKESDLKAHPIKKDHTLRSNSLFNTTLARDLVLLDLNVKKKSTGKVVRAKDLTLDNSLVLEYQKQLLNLQYALVSYGNSPLEDLILSKNPWQLNLKAEQPQRSYFSVLAREALVQDDLKLNAKILEQLDYYAQAHFLKYALNNTNFATLDPFSNELRFLKLFQKDDEPLQITPETITFLKLFCGEDKAKKLERLLNHLAIDGRVRFLPSGYNIDENTGLLVLKDDSAEDETDNNSPMLIDSNYHNQEDFLVDWLGDGISTVHFIGEENTNSRCKDNSIFQELVAKAQNLEQLASLDLEQAQNLVGEAFTNLWGLDYTFYDDPKVLYDFQLHNKFVKVPNNLRTITEQDLLRIINYTNSIVPHKLRTSMGCKDFAQYQKEEQFHFLPFINPAYSSNPYQGICSQWYDDIKDAQDRYTVKMLNQNNLNLDQRCSILMNDVRFAKWNYSASELLLEAKLDAVRYERLVSNILKFNSQESTIKLPPISKLRELVKDDWQKAFSFIVNYQQLAGQISKTDTKEDLSGYRQIASIFSSLIDEQVNENHIAGKNVKVQFEQADLSAFAENDEVKIKHSRTALQEEYPEVLALRNFSDSYSASEFALTAMRYKLLKQKVDRIEHLGFDHLDNETLNKLNNLRLLVLNNFREQGKVDASKYQWQKPDDSQEHIGQVPKNLSVQNSLASLLPQSVVLPSGAAEHQVEYQQFVEVYAHLFSIVLIKFIQRLLNPQLDELFSPSLDYTLDAEQVDFSYSPKQAQTEQFRFDPKEPHQQTSYAKSERLVHMDTLNTLKELKRRAATKDAEHPSWSLLDAISNHNWNWTFTNGKSLAQALNVLSKLNDQERIFAVVGTMFEAQPDLQVVFECLMHKIWDCLNFNLDPIEIGSEVDLAKQELRTHISKMVDSAFATHLKEDLYADLTASVKTTPSGLVDLSLSKDKKSGTILEISHSFQSKEDQNLQALLKENDQSFINSLEHYFESMQDSFDDTEMAQFGLHSKSFNLKTDVQLTHFLSFMKEVLEKVVEVGLSQRLSQNVELIKTYQIPQPEQEIETKDKEENDRVVSLNQALDKVLEPDLVHVFNNKKEQKAEKLTIGSKKDPKANLDHILIDAIFCQRQEQNQQSLSAQLAKKIQVHSFSHFTQWFDSLSAMGLPDAKVVNTPDISIDTYNALKDFIEDSVGKILPEYTEEGGEEQEQQGDVSLINNIEQKDTSNKKTEVQNVDKEQNVLLRKVSNVMVDELDDPSSLVSTLLETAKDFNQTSYSQPIRPRFFDQVENPLHVFIYCAILEMKYRSKQYRERLVKESIFLDALNKLGYFFGASDLIDSCFTCTINESSNRRFRRTQALINYALEEKFYFYHNLSVAQNIGQDIFGEDSDKASDKVELDEEQNLRLEQERESLINSAMFDDFKIYCHKFLDQYAGLNPGFKHELFDKTTSSPDFISYLKDLVVHFDYCVSIRDLHMMAIAQATVENLRDDLDIMIDDSYLHPTMLDFFRKVPTRLDLFNKLNHTSRDNYYKTLGLKPGTYDDLLDCKTSFMQFTHKMLIQTKEQKLRINPLMVLGYKEQILPMSFAENLKWSTGTFSIDVYLDAILQSCLERFFGEQDSLELTDYIQEQSFERYLVLLANFKEILVDAYKDDKKVKNILTNLIVGFDKPGERTYKFSDILRYLLEFDVDQNVKYPVKKYIKEHLTEIKQQLEQCGIANSSLLERI